MNMYTSFTDWESGLYLEHHGIRGQKWGVRNYQNSDGTLTAAGRAHYGVGQGGSKRMSRQYDRQVKKLNRLMAKADKDTQRANIEKYNKRAKTAMKVGNVAAGVAAATGLGALGLGHYSRNLGELTNRSARRESQRIWDAGESAISEQNSISDLVENGSITKGYGTKLNNDAFTRYEQQRDAIKAQEKQYRIDTNNKINIVDTVRKVKTGITYAAAGTAAVSYGVAAVSKLQARAAKTRLTDAGHQKAVQKARAQVTKMEKMFANTPYSELVKQQSKKTNGKS